MTKHTNRLINVGWVEERNPTSARLITEEISQALLYVEKWDRILFSTKQIDRKKAKTAIENAYKIIKANELKHNSLKTKVFVPDIVFLSSPSPENLLSFIDSPELDTGEYCRLKASLNYILFKSIADKKDTSYAIKDHAERKYYFLDRTEKFKYFCQKIYSETLYYYDSNTDRYYNLCKILDSEFLQANPWVHDFQINHLGDDCDLEVWKALMSLCEECPYLLAFENIAIVIERPTELYLDRELLPHAEGKAAIKFADGYEIYCDRGIIIPAKYGKLNHIDWNANSILTENDSEDNEDLIGVLLRGVGYKRFSEELLEEKDKYWQKDRNFKNETLIDNAIDAIADWQLFHYYDFYNSSNNNINSKDFHKIINNLPFKLPQDLYNLYLC